MLGNCAIGSCTMATTPMITITIEMTIATIGRLMKNLAMTIYLGSGFAVGLASDIAVNGFGLTVMPALTLCIPSATTLSPGFNPSSTIGTGQRCFTLLRLRDCSGAK